MMSILTNLSLTYPSPTLTNNELEFEKPHNLVRGSHLVNPIININGKPIWAVPVIYHTTIELVVSRGHRSLRLRL
jgi:hypothetical protein